MCLCAPPPWFDPRSDWTTTCASMCVPLTLASSSVWLDTSLCVRVLLPLSTFSFWLYDDLCSRVPLSLTASSFWLYDDLRLCAHFLSCFHILPASSIWLDYGMCSCLPFLLVVSLYWRLDFGMCLYASLSLASFQSISVYACAVPYCVSLPFAASQ